eukprot:scaffold1598_cov100-Skeletonema_dohrnii-CCMP3373.AAC.5
MPPLPRCNTQCWVLARCTYAGKVGDLRKEAIGSSQLSASKEFRRSSSGRIRSTFGELLAGWPIKRLHLHQINIPL